MEFSRQEHWSGLPCPPPGDLPNPGIEPMSSASRWIHLSHQGSPRILDWVACPLSRGSSPPSNWTGVSCIAGQFFTCWATTYMCMCVCVYVYIHIYGFPSGASGKESACQGMRHKRHQLNLWVRKIPWRTARQSTPVFLPRESHGRRSLVGYNPWGCKELDMTVRLIPMHTHNGILLSHKNESDFVICSNTDGLWGYYAKWNKLEKDK